MPAPFKSRVFFLRKVMPAERTTMGGVWAFQMCRDSSAVVRSGLTTRPFFVRSSNFSSRFCIGSPRASQLFLGHCKANYGQLFSHRRTWASRCPNLLICTFFALFANAAHILISWFAHSFFFANAPLLFNLSQVNPKCCKLCCKLL